MADDIGLTGENWYGTQMKPDLWEPATAEWAGRLAMNAGWLFEQQQQTIWGEDEQREHVLETGDDQFHQAFYRRFWLNEVIGTVRFRFYLVRELETVIRATLYHGASGQDGVEATYTTDGDKALTFELDEDWYISQVDPPEFNFASLRVHIRMPDAEPPPNAWFTRMRLEGHPRE